MNTKTNFLLGGLFLLGCYGLNQLTSNPEPSVTITEQRAPVFDYDGTYARYKRGLEEQSWNKIHTSNNYPTRKDNNLPQNYSYQHREWETYEKRELINGEIQLRKVHPSGTPAYRFNDGSDEFNDRYDEWRADPEDESEFDPDIFDFYRD